MSLQLHAVERDLERLEAEAGERAPHDGLPGRLLAEERRRRDELAEQVGDGVLLGRHGGDDLGIHGA